MSFTVLAWMLEFITHLVENTLDVMLCYVMLCYVIWVRDVFM